MKVTELIYDNSTVGYRFELGVRNYAFDLSSLILRDRGLPTPKASSKAILKDVNGTLMTEKEFKSGVAIKDYSDNMHLLQALFSSYIYTPLDYFIGEEIGFVAIKLAAGLNGILVETVPQSKFVEAAHAMNVDSITKNGRPLSGHLKYLEKLVAENNIAELEQVLVKGTNIDLFVKRTRQNGAIQGMIDVIDPAKAENSLTKADKELMEHVLKLVISRVADTEGLSEEDLQSSEALQMIDSLRHVLMVVVNSNFGMGLAKYATVLNKAAKADTPAEFQKLLTQFGYSGNLLTARNVVIEQGAKRFIINYLYAHMTKDIK